VVELARAVALAVFDDAARLVSEAGRGHRVEEAQVALGRRVAEWEVDVDDPMVAEGEQVARQLRIVTVVGYHWRHFSHARQLRELLTGERVGMALGYFLNVLPGSPWWRIKSRSGGQVVEQAIHIFDTSRYLLGEVERVWADYALRANYDEPGFEQEDVYTINLRFASGVVANYAVCCILHRRWHVGLDILCKHRAYRLSEKELWTLIGAHPHGALTRAAVALPSF